MTSHPQDKADKSIRLPEKGVGFVTIAKGICYNDKKDLLHQDGCMGGVQVLQQKVDISGCRRWNRKNNEVVKETLHICSTIIDRICDTGKASLLKERCPSNVKEFAQ